MKSFISALLILTAYKVWAQDVLPALIVSEKQNFINAKQAQTCAASSTYDVKHYRCNWNIDPALAYISGSVTMSFVSMVPLDSIEMDLAITLVMDSVYHNSSKINAWQKTGDVLVLKFAGALAPGVLDSVTVYYHGFPQSTGFGSYMTTVQGNNVPVAWTLSEPYGAKDWWPCKQTLEDKADSVDIFITAPASNKAASNGVLQQVSTMGTNKVFHWKHRYPIATYLVCAAVTDYSEFTDSVNLKNGKLPVLYYTYPQDSVNARQTEAQLLTLLAYYDSLFIAYPFMNEKYGHAQFSWGGGMEHQTMTFLGGYYVDLIAHELAHQWFGNHVTCSSWRDIWLNEGFAVYLTGMGMGRLYGAGAFRTWQEQQIGYITSQPGGSVYVDDTTDVSRIFNGRLSYAKGGYLLHMLRWKLGDSAFFTAIRNYENDPVANYAFGSTGLLQQHLEAASGQDLDNFFTQWFFGQGYPSYLTIWNQDAGDQLKIILNQTTSHDTVSFFEMPVPLRIKGQGRDTILVFNHAYNGQIFYSNPGFKADSVLFDPELKILSAQNKVVREYEYLRSLEDLVIYPNPAVTQLNIEINDLSNYPEKVELFDVLGRKMLEARPQSNKFSLDVSAFAQGTYYLRILSGIKRTSYKILVAKQN